MSLGLLGGAARAHPGGGGRAAEATRSGDRRPDAPDALALFLCGDVMTGRGIDQILPRPSDPRLYERSVKSAADYVALAERRHGRLSRPVDFSYVWGDALEVLRRAQPDVRIINLETAVTTSEEPWPDKGVHYRMHPENVACLTRAGFQCCALANNHVLDWGPAGLAETLATLRSANLASAGAGRNLEEAAAPAVLPSKVGGRVLVFAFGHESSGIPRSWAAGENRAGVHLLEDFSERSIERVAEQVRAAKQPGDVAVASIHWGDNWGYRIPDEQRRFAHGLVDGAGIDVIHGHSSHHPKGVEVHADRPILYGCGEFIDDYEGIGGYERFRGDLSLLYFLRLDRASGRLRSLEAVPMQIHRFRLRHASPSDARWLARRLHRESAVLGSAVELNAEGTLVLGWRGRS